jgi:hypothetical protein
MWVLSAAAIAFLLWQSRIALLRWTAAGGPVPPIWGSPAFWACALFAIAFALRLHFVWANPRITEAFSIQGAPFSDARFWSRMAEGMAAGGGADVGFPGKRPLFSMVLALFYTWTGISLPVAKLVQVLLGALTSAFVFLIFRRLGGFWAALAAGLYFAIDSQQVLQTVQLMTEPLGILCVVLSAWLLILAGPRLALWPLLGAGIALGLSNLARPLTLFGFPLYALLICVQTFRNGGRTLRALSVPVGVFALGVAICLGPWVVRQHKVHGIWSISDNSAPALFGASTPEYGTWTWEVEELPGKAGLPYTVKGRYDFFQRGFRENLAKYPGYYWRHVLEGLIPAAAGVNFVTPDFRAAGWFAFGLVALFGLLRRVWFPTLAAAMSSVLLAFVTAATAHWLALAGFFWMLRRKPFPTLVTGVTFISAILGSALFGNSALPRMRFLIDWLEAGWVFVALLEGSRLAIGLVMGIPVSAWAAGDDSEERKSPHPALHKTLRWTAWLAVAFLLISSSRLVALNTFFPPKSARKMGLRPELQRQAMAMLVERMPEWKPLVAHLERGTPIAGVPKFIVRRGWLGGYTYFFPANLEIHHPADIFNPRPYDHSIVEIYKDQYGFGSYLMGILPREVPRSLLDRPCVLAGFLMDTPLTKMDSFPSMEILAIIPGIEVTAEAVGRAVLAPPVPETTAWIEAIKAHQATELAQ